jgi:hypothetical protein
MQDRNQQTADGEPLVDRGTIDPDQDTLDDEGETPVDETDSGPEPVIVIKDDDR